MNNKDAMAYHLIKLKLYNLDKPILSLDVINDIIVTKEVLRQLRHLSLHEVN